MRQLALFEQRPIVRRDQRDILFEFALSDEFAEELLAYARTRPNEWITVHDFWVIANRHGAGSYFGHALGKLARAGKLQEKKIYFGSDHPGKGDYRGFMTVYMYAERALA